MEIAKKTLRIGRHKMYALKNKHDQNTNNKAEVIKVVEKTYRKLYSCNHR